MITVPDIGESVFSLIENGKIGCIVYTGALMDSTVDDYIALHRRALCHAIPCFTSLDTANAFADTIAGRYSQFNTELVDINHMRKTRIMLKFAKMQGTGDDYIFIENFDGRITCPESLCISLCDRHYGVGGYGIVLLENSDVADVKMRMFNRDGSEGSMAGSCIRCTGKYLYDNGIVDKEKITVETASGVKNLELYIFNGRVSLVSVDMGKAILEPSQIPCNLNSKRAVNVPVDIGGSTYFITCLSMGNPHCVVFCDRVDGVDIDRTGPLFEHSHIFPNGVNTEFVRVVNESMLKMRVWERGSGETMACGTGACAAAVAAVLNGFCEKGSDITVKVRGGDLIVNYTDERVILTGDAKLVYNGVTEF